MKILIQIFIVLTLVSCRYNGDYSKLLSLKDDKIEVESILDEELNPENQLKLKNYFNKISELIYVLKNNSKLSKYFHRNFFKYYKTSLCEQVVLSKSSYKSVLDKCTVNQFYICAEEVRHYKELLKELKKSFTENELNTLKEEESCKELLEGLEV